VFSPKPVANGTTDANRWGSWRKPRKPKSQEKGEMNMFGLIFKLVSLATEWQWKTGEWQWKTDEWQWF
jgi:hypothetical protein